MADKKQLSNLQKLQQEEKALLELQKQKLKNEKDLHHMQEKKLARIQSEIAYQETLTKEQTKGILSFNKLNSKLQKQLQGQNSEANTFLSLNNSIAKAKAREAKFSKFENAKAKEKVQFAQSQQSVLGEIQSDLLSQAKATQKAEDNLRGISSIEQEIRDFKAESVGYDEEERKLGENALNQKKLLQQKEERLNTLAEERQSVFNALPGPIQDMVNGAKRFGKALAAGAGPIVIIGAILVAALKSFSSLNDAAKGFRETTGLTNSQMEGMRTQANQLSGELGFAGVNAEKVFGTMSALTSEFSDIARFGDEVVGGLTLLNTNFGVSAESAAKVQGIFEQIGGLTSETAAGVQLQVANMAKLAGVAPAKIFEDIAENAEIASTLFQGDVESLTKAAIEARRLGTNLKSVAATSEHLLDFQSNIGDELVAATFVGGQFSLTQARSLAAAGKHVDAQKEVLRQLQRSGDFRKKDYFTQQQMAKAAGMSVEDINKQLNAQEKLNSLTSEQRKIAEDAISQGLDISDINKDQLSSQVSQFAKQQEMQDSVEKLSNSFMGIAAAVGTALVPALDGVMAVISPIAQVIGSIFGFFAEIPGFFPAIIAGLTTMYIMTKRQAISSFFSAIPEIFRTFAGIPFGLGIPLAVGAVAGLASLMSKPPAIADDMSGVPSGYGNTMVTTAGKGTIALNNSDSFVAGTNLGQGGGNDAKMDMLIAAVKQTKDVYMDGRRVTSRVASSVEKSSKNQYGFG
jgi:hypothetical protein